MKAILSMRYQFFCYLFICSSLCVKAQDTLLAGKADNYYDMSLEELMSIKISVASVKELTQHESPGIVTFITADDIKNLGARSLLDLLKIVPGFDFGVDVEGVIGIGVRGNWAHEGKILLIIDGQQMNENLYSTIQLGDHYPVDNIERVEIIRGPGSAVYGDCAEYAVINVITKRAKDLNGIGVSSYFEQTQKGSGWQNINFLLGEEQKGFSYSFSGFLSQSKSSTGIYNDVYGSSYDMTNQSDIRNSNMNLGLNIKDYQFRGIIDNYSLYTRDAYDRQLSKPYLMSFDSYFLELKKEYNINSRFLLTPKFNYKNQTPWAFNDVSVNDEFARFKINSQQLNASVTGAYDINSHFNFIAGTEFIKHIAKQETGSVFLTTQSSRLEYKTLTLFAQALFKTKFACFTAGVRYNNNDLFAASFVPRFGITKTVNKFHLKLLYSKAFRAPNTENIDLNAAILPEKTQVFEAETGYEITSKMLFTINAYYIETKDPIIYYYDETNFSDAYLNMEKAGTRGFEIEYKFKSGYGYSSINYSFYTPLENVLSNYAVPDNGDALLAFATHKINLTSGLKLTSRLKINVSVSVLGPRYGITAYDENSGNVSIEKFDPSIIANFNLSYDHLLVKNLSASFGVTNFFDAKDCYIQPYNSLHAPLPGKARSFGLKLSYNINFKHNK